MVSLDIAAFHMVENNFFSLVSYRQENFGAVITFATGDNKAGLNPALVISTDEFESKLEACESFYADKSVPWALLVPDYLMSETVADILGERAYVFQSEGIAMVLEAKNAQHGVANRKLEIREIGHDLATWIIPVSEGFESVPDGCAIYVERHAQAMQKPVANLFHFCGFVDGVPVCSLTLSIKERNARIDDVATRPDYQRNGYASELLVAALDYAWRSKVEKCFLEASASGLAVYERLGFQKLFANRYYELKQP